MQKTEEKKLLFAFEKEFLIIYNFDLIQNFDFVLTSKST